MPVQFDIRTLVEKNTELPLDRLRVVQSLPQFHLASIRRGVILIFAAWSPLASVSLRRVTRLLAPLDLDGVDIIVLDNDCMSDADMIQRFGHVFHGAREALWIRDGRIVTELSAAPPESEQLVLTRTKEQLDVLD